MSRYVTPASKHASKSGDVEDGIDRVEHRVGPGLADQLEHRVATRGVDPVGGEAPVVEGVDERRGSREVVVGEGAMVEERAPSGDRPRTRSRHRPCPRRGCASARFYTILRDICLATRRSRRNVMSVAVTQQKMFVDGAFVDALSGETMEVLNPATGEVIAEVPKASADDVDRAVAAAEKAWDDLALEDAEGPDGAPAEARRRDRRERRGARAARVAERRQALVGRRRRARRDVRQPPLLRRRRADARGQGGGRVRGGLHLDDPPRAARDRRRDRTVELPALHGDLEARAGARGRERPDHQAGRADAAHRRSASSSSPRSSCRRASCRSSRAKAFPPGTVSCDIRR